MSTSSIQDLWIEEVLSEHITIDFSMDYSWLLEFIGQNFHVEDVFPISALEDWAEENGYVREL